jgi:hypothetical protein
MTEAATDQQIEWWNIGKDCPVPSVDEWVDSLIARIEQDQAKGQRMAEALRELVTLRSMKDGYTARELERSTYAERKGPAWEAARAALSGEKE